MLFIVNEEDEEEEVVIEETDVTPEVEMLEVVDNAEVALVSVFEFSTKGTMKLNVTVNGKEVIVIVGCSTTHKFIHQRIVEKLKLPLSSIAKYGVIIGKWYNSRGKQSV